MNYRDEVRALHRWLEAGRLTACDIALWHALHDVAMLSGQEQGLAEVPRQDARYGNYCMEATRGKGCRRISNFAAP